MTDNTPFNPITDDSYEEMSLSKRLQLEDFILERDKRIEASKRVGQYTPDSRIQFVSRASIQATDVCDTLLGHIASRRETVLIRPNGTDRIIIKVGTGEDRWIMELFDRMMTIPFDEVIPMGEGNVVFYFSHTLVAIIHDFDDYKIEGERWQSQ